jgi:hypothetical protein
VASVTFVEDDFGANNFARSARGVERQIDREIAQATGLD